MDMQHTDEIVLDPNELAPIFVELKIKEFKTKKANAWRGGTMAAVGPASGVVQCKEIGSQHGGASDRSSMQL